MKENSRFIKSFNPSNNPKIDSNSITFYMTFYKKKRKKKSYEILIYYYLSLFENAISRIKYKIKRYNETSTSRQVHGKILPQVAIKKKKRNESIPRYPGYHII